jgi:hypothetical protein
MMVEENEVKVEWGADVERRQKWSFVPPIAKKSVLKTYRLCATHQATSLGEHSCQLIPELLHIPYMPRSDSSPDSSSEFSDDEDYRLAQKEWNDSMEELQQLALVLLLPWVGKYLGRRWSYWRMYIASYVASGITNNTSCSVRSLHPCRSWEIIFHRREAFGMVLLLAMTEACRII